MPPKTLSLTTLILLCFTMANAQMITTYYNAKGKRVSNKDSADYTRTIEKPDTGKYFILNEYYKNGKTKLTGKTSQPLAVVLEGECVSYYPDGAKKQVATYMLGMPSGNVYNYYPNGKLSTMVYHELQHPTPTSFVQKSPLYQVCNSPAGESLTANGNGHFTVYDADNKNIIDEGNVVSGQKEGEWKGTDDMGKIKISFTETYKHNKLLSGHSVDQDGNGHDYDEIQKQPEYDGGFNVFYSFLSRNIAYPAYEKENSIQGRVIAQFVVEQDGTITDIRIMRSPSPGLANEAKRVLSLSPKWIPGLMRGVPVRVQYAVPINFALGSR